MQSEEEQPAPIDKKERYKQALKERMSSNASASQRQERLSQERASINSKSQLDRESFTAFSNRVSNRVRDINQVRSSPLRAKKQEEAPYNDEMNTSLRIALGLDGNPYV